MNGFERRFVQGRSSSMAGGRAGRLLAAAWVAAMGAAAGAQMQVVATVPAQNAGGAARTAPISVTFDRAVNPATLTPANFYAFGRWSGPISGAVTLSNAGRTATLTPTRPLMAGEQVMLVISHDVRGADGVALRQAGYTMSFMTRVLGTAGIFAEETRFSDRSPNGAQTRIYGGLACDLDMNGWADLTIINEVSADIRVFLNRSDGSGLFQPMLAPPTPIPFESSPNEPADFNRDGFVDVVTSSNAENRMAIAWGNGDGTFDPPTEIPTGSYPRGFGIIDADGDGDLDIAVACTIANRVELYLNNGAGGFGAPTFFEAGGNGEYGMQAVDMNADGIMDLVVGCTNSETVCVLRGNGNGTFTSIGCADAGGANWVLMCADLDGDGDVDVTSANSFSSTAGVLFNNGAGALTPAVVYPVSGHTVATDLADFEGDGDMDMIVSCFGGNRWHFFENNGTGAFSPRGVFMAPANPACCLPADFDNDGDVDLALIDEIADLIILLDNTGRGCEGDVSGDGNVDQGDVDYMVNVVGGGANPTGIDPDFNHDGNVDQGDVDALLNVVAGGACP